MSRALYNNVVQYFAVNALPDAAGSIRCSSMKGVPEAAELSHSTEPAMNRSCADLITEGYFTSQ